MPQTPREVLRKAMTFEYPDRIPYAWNTLPWADEHYPEELNQLRKDFPCDTTWSSSPYRASAREKGFPCKAGTYIDEWGCVFENLLDGVIGEVKKPIIENLADYELVEPPYDTLPLDTESAYAMIREAHKSKDLFLCAGCCPRPWERYQFLRGTENAMMDVAYEDVEFFKLLDKIHQYYLAEFEFWAKSDVDGLFFMDDWGTQISLLISPESWRKIFKPLYRDYCKIAHRYNKVVMMHSDGNILSILPDLIEIGVNAVNSQLFSMDLDAVAEITRGKIALWGEIDRQHILTDPDPDAGRRAVRAVADRMFTPKGGLICNLEFGPGANPATIRATLEEWSLVGVGK